MKNAVDGAPESQAASTADSSLTIADNLYLARRVGQPTTAAGVSELLTSPAVALFSAFSIWILAFVLVLAANGAINHVSSTTPF